MRGLLCSKLRTKNPQLRRVRTRDPYVRTTTREEPLSAGAVDEKLPTKNYARNPESSRNPHS